jgi:hypothetical protein
MKLKFFLSSIRFYQKIAKSLKKFDIHELIYVPVFKIKNLWFFSIKSTKISNFLCKKFLVLKNELSLNNIWIPRALGAYAEKTRDRSSSAEHI